MKVRKIFLVTAIFLSTLLVNAQIENEIRTYVDSTETTINNGKRLLLSEVRAMNYDKAAEIYAYLNQKTAENNCSAFTYNEHLAIALIVSDWDAFLTKAEQVKTNLYFCYQNMQSIQRELFEEFQKYNDIFYKNFQNAGLNDEDTKLIALFYLATDQNNNRDYYESAYKAFQKKYPQSKYTDFLKHYFPTPSVPLSMVMSFGATGVFPNSNFGSNFTNGIGPTMDLAFTYKQWYFGLIIQTTTLRSKYDFISYADRGEIYSFYPEDKFDFEMVGLKSGYKVFKSNRFALTPYVALGGSNLTSNIYPNAKDDKNELRLLRSFYVGPGISSELKLAQFKGSNANEWNPTPPSYLALRFDIGYNMLTNRKFDMLSGDVSYASLKLTYAIGYFNR